MDNVIVMMSSYNGEQYIEEQINSILTQKDVNVHLLIRDDGSTDNTLSILHDYLLSHPSIIEIIEGTNIGWRKSFFELIKYAGNNYSSYSYFAFADQDDIWLPDKLNKAISKISSLSDVISLYCSNQLYYKNGNIHGIAVKEHINPTYKNCLVRNYATGCTIVFNRNLLLRLAKKLPRIEIAHDYWAYMVAMLCGKVVIDNEAYILYRQHENNQIGIRSGFINVWKRRFNSIFKTINSHERENIAKELLTLHGEFMSEEAKKSVVKIANYKSSFYNRIQLLNDKDYSLGRKSNDLWLKLRIIFGKL